MDSKLNSDMEPAENTDRKMWGGIIVTKEGAIGIENKGKVIVRTPEKWHEAATYYGSTKMINDVLKILEAADLSKLNKPLLWANAISAARVMIYRFMNDHTDTNATPPQETPQHSQESVVHTPDCAIAVNARHGCTCEGEKIQPEATNNDASRSHTKSPFEGTSVAYYRFIQALNAHPDYAYGWWCNIAMPIKDHLKVDNAEADRVADHLMKHLFDVDMHAVRLALLGHQTDTNATTTEKPQ